MADIFKNAAESTVNTLDEVLNNLGDVTNSYIGLEKIIPSVTEALLEQGKELRMLNKELGTGTKTSSALRKEMAALSTQTGISYNSQVKLLDVTKQFHQSLNETSATTLKFIKASGAQVDVVGKLSAKLKLLGISSDSTFRGMYENILKVRDAYGLTTDQIDNITSSLTKYGIIVRASDSSMKEASKSMALFTSKLTSAGIEADSVQGIINDMLDPDKLSDNIMLFSKMGLTFSDMTSGDPVSKLEGSVDKLKALGVEIANMAETSRWSASQMAKLYGLSLEDALQLSQISNENKVLDNSKTIDTFKQEVSSFSVNVENLYNILTNSIAGPVSIIGDIVEKFTNTLGMVPNAVLSTVLAVVGVKTIKKIRDGISNLTGEFATKFASTISSSMTGLLNESSKKLGAKEADARAAMSNNVSKAGLRSGLGFDKSSAPIYEALLNKTMDRERFSRDFYEAASPSTKKYNDTETLRELLETTANLQFKYKDQLDSLLSMKQEDLTTSERNLLEQLKTQNDEFRRNQNDWVEKLSNITLNVDTENIAGFGLGVENIVKESNVDRAKKYYQENSGSLLSSLGGAVQGPAFDLLKKDFSDFDSVKNLYSSSIDEKGNASTKSILSAMSSSYSSKLAGIDKSTGKIGDETDDAFKTRQADIKAISEKIEIIKKQADALDGSFADVTSNVKDITDSIVKYTKEADKNLKGAIKDSIGGGGNYFRNLGGSIVKRLPGAGLVAKIAGSYQAQKTENPNLSFTGYAVNSVKENAQKTAGKFRQKAGETIANGISNLGRLAKGAALGGLGILGGVLISKLKDNEKVQATFTNISSKFTGVIEKISTAIAPVFEKLAPIFDSIGGTLAETISGIAQTLIPAVSGIAQLVLPLVAKILVPVSKVISFIAKAISAIIKPITKLFGATYEEIPKISDNVANIEENVVKQDLKEMTLGYATYESWKNGIIGKSISDLGEKLDRINSNTYKSAVTSEEAANLAVAARAVIS